MTKVQTARVRAGSGRAAASKGITPMREVRLLDDVLVYKASEVAKLLNLNIQTVHKLIRRGELLALDLRVAGSPQATWRITRASLEMYLSQASQPRAAVAGVR